jgi:hypothetical protein
VREEAEVAEGMAEEELDVGWRLLLAFFSPHVTDKQSVWPSRSFG